MRGLIAVAFLLCACGNAPNAEQASSPAAGAEVDMGRPELVGSWVWEVDEDASTLAFLGEQDGQGFEGEFTDWDAAVRLDPETLDDAEIDVRIRMTSARTGDAERDEALPSRDWFDSASHPYARFRATDITLVTDDEYLARGELSLRGVTRDVELPFTLEIEGVDARARGAVMLDRSDFAVGQGQFESDQWIAHPVRVEVDLVATREDG